VAGAGVQLHRRVVADADASRRINGQRVRVGASTPAVAAALAAHAAAQPVITAVVPAAIPSAGDVLLHVRGTALVHSDGVAADADVVRCVFRFHHHGDSSDHPTLDDVPAAGPSAANTSQVTVDASYHGGTRSIVCLAPPAPPTGTSGTNGGLQVVTFGLALLPRNASRVHQWVVYGKRLTYYRPGAPAARPLLASAFPNRLAAAGGSVIALTGRHLAGAQLACDFGVPPLVSPLLPPAVGVVPPTGTGSGGREEETGFLEVGQGERGVAAAAAARARAAARSAALAHLDALAGLAFDGAPAPVLLEVGATRAAGQSLLAHSLASHAHAARNVAGSRTGNGELTAHAHATLPAGAGATDGSATDVVWCTAPPAPPAPLPHRVRLVDAASNNTAASNWLPLHYIAPIRLHPVAPQPRHVAAGDEVTINLRLPPANWAALTAELGSRPDVADVICRFAGRITATAVADASLPGFRCLLPPAPYLRAAAAVGVVVTDGSTATSMASAAAQEVDASDLLDDVALLPPRLAAIVEALVGGAVDATLLPDDDELQDDLPLQSRVTSVMHFAPPASVALELAAGTPSPPLAPPLSVAGLPPSGGMPPPHPLHNVPATGQPVPGTSGVGASGAPAAPMAAPNAAGSTGVAASGTTGNAGAGSIGGAGTAGAGAGADGGAGKGAGPGAAAGTGAGAAAGSSTGAAGDRTPAVPLLTLRGQVGGGTGSRVSGTIGGVGGTNNVGAGGSRPAIATEVMAVAGAVLAHLPTPYSLRLVRPVVRAYVAARQLADLPADGTVDDEAGAAIAVICHALHTARAVSCGDDSGKGPAYACATIGTLLRVLLRDECGALPPLPSPAPPAHPTVHPAAGGDTWGDAPLPLKVELSVDGGATWETAAHRLVLHDPAFVRLTVPASPAAAAALPPVAVVPRVLAAAGGTVVRLAGVPPYMAASWGAAAARGGLVCDFGGHRVPAVFDAGHLPRSLFTSSAEGGTRLNATAVAAARARGVILVPPAFHCVAPPAPTQCSHRSGGDTPCTTPLAVTLDGVAVPLAAWPLDSSDDANNNNRDDLEPVAPTLLLHYASQLLPRRVTPNVAPAGALIAITATALDCSTPLAAAQSVVVRLGSVNDGSMVVHGVPVPVGGCEWSVVARMPQSPSLPDGGAHAVAGGSVALSTARGAPFVHRADTLAGETGAGSGVPRLDAVLLVPPLYATYVSPATAAPVNGTLRLHVAVTSFVLAPPTGPAAGGTRLLVLGIGLGGGVVYKCRFGGTVVVPAQYVNATAVAHTLGWQHVPAPASDAAPASDGRTADASLAAVACTVPPLSALPPRRAMGGLAATVPVALSFDGGVSWTDDSEEDGGGHAVARAPRFTYYDGTWLGAAGWDGNLGAPAGGRGGVGSLPRAPPPPPGGAPAPPPPAARRCRLGGAAVVVGVPGAATGGLRCRVPSAATLSRAAATTPSTDGATISLEVSINGGADWVALQQRGQWVAHAAHAPSGGGVAVGTVPGMAVAVAPTAGMVGAHTEVGVTGWAGALTAAPPGATLWCLFAFDAAPPAGGGEDDLPPRPLLVPATVIDGGGPLHGMAQCTAPPLAAYWARYAPRSTAAPTDAVTAVKEAATIAYQVRAVRAAVAAGRAALRLPQPHAASGAGLVFDALDGVPVNVSSDGTLPPGVASMVSVALDIVIAAAAALRPPLATTSFTYIPPLAVAAVTPRLVPSAGGRTVTIRLADCAGARHGHDSAFVRVGGNLVAAVWAVVSSSPAHPDACPALLAALPPLPPGRYAVEVSLTGQHFSAPPVGQEVVALPPRRAALVWVTDTRAGTDGSDATTLTRRLVYFAFAAGHGEAAQPRVTFVLSVSGTAVAVPAAPCPGSNASASSLPAPPAGCIAMCADLALSVLPAVGAAQPLVHLAHVLVHAPDHPGIATPRPLVDDNDGGGWMWDGSSGEAGAAARPLTPDVWLAAAELWGQVDTNAGTGGADAGGEMASASVVGDVSNGGAAGASAQSDEVWVTRTANARLVPAAGVPAAGGGGASGGGGAIAGTNGGGGNNGADGVPSQQADTPAPPHLAALPADNPDVQRVLAAMLSSGSVTAVKQAAAAAAASPLPAAAGAALMEQQTPAAAAPDGVTGVHVVLYTGSGRALAVPAALDARRGVVEARFAATSAATALSLPAAASQRYRLAYVRIVSGELPRRTQGGSSEGGGGEGSGCDPAGAGSKSTADDTTGTSAAALCSAGAWSAAVDGNAWLSPAGGLVVAPWSAVSDATPLVLDAAALVPGPGTGTTTPADGSWAADGGGGAVFALRLIPQLLAQSPYPLPRSLLGRRAFDAAVVGDLAAASGTQARRWAVTDVAADTGVLRVHVRASSSGGEAAVADVVARLLADVRVRAPALMAGRVTWALDGLFPASSLQWVGGVPHVGGSCTNPTLLTPAACASVGVCSCSGVPRDAPDECAAALTANGGRCAFIPEFRWSAAPAPAPLAYGTCEDARFLSEAECLADGQCSDPAYVGRDACEADGACDPPPTLASQQQRGTARPPRVLHFAQFTSARTCRDPAARRRLRNGHCVPPAATANLNYPYHQHTTREACEEPLHRSLPPGADASGYGCVARPDASPEDAAVDYTRFTNQGECEEPDMRPACAATGDVLLQVASGPLPAANAVDDMAAVPWRYPTQPASPPPSILPPRPGDDIIVPEDGGTPESAASSATVAASAAATVRPSVVPSSPPPSSKPKAAVPRRVSPSAAAAAVPSGGDDEPPAPKAADCGPAGVWTNRAGPPGRWIEDGGDVAVPSSDDEDLVFQYERVPGVWRSSRTFRPARKWRTGAFGAATKDPCPCNWQADKYHLSKCNWWRCGPAVRGTSSDGYIGIQRQKDAIEMVSDYQAFVSVGGRKLWMNLDTGTACSWAMSAACFMEGCLDVQLFLGAFIPTIPPQFVIIDLLERGFMQIGSMAGFLGHTMMRLAGTFVMGAPLAMGILDIGNIGETTYNHSGNIGFGYWEEAWANWLLPRDPVRATCIGLLPPTHAPPPPTPHPPPRSTRSPSRCWTLCAPATSSCPSRWCPCPSPSRSSCGACRPSSRRASSSSSRSSCRTAAAASS